MTLRSYILPAVKGEGWAKFVIDTSDGYFSVVSDFGNYAYRWSNTGKEFRTFLIGISGQYLLSKLVLGWDLRERYDVDASKVRLEEAILESLEGTEQEEELEAVRACDSESQLLEWAADTRLGDASELLITENDPQVSGFCMRVWPRFVAELQSELMAEAFAVPHFNRPSVSAGE